MALSNSAQAKRSAHPARNSATGKIPLSAAPSAVYRLQFNQAFSFKSALPLIPYLKNLGIDYVYCSSYLQAVRESMHGYNVTDPNKINPEIDGEEDYNEFCEALQKHGIGQILDVVPNHMGIIGSQNPWWRDVLENGPSSIYAHFFDIDWSPPKKEITDKVLIPILGDHYGTVLENQEIRLAYASGEFLIEYGGQQFPVAPDTYPLILELGIKDLESRSSKEDRDFLDYINTSTAFRRLPPRSERNSESKAARSRDKETAKKRLAALTGASRAIREFVESRLAIFNGRKDDPRSFDLLDRLLNEQAYRLAYWRVASEEINYRRFFDINDLAAIRMEDPDVFEQYHQLIFRLIREEKIHGLRIDHPDGLYDPPEYFRRLQRYYVSQFAVQKGAGEQEDAPLFIVAEKILDLKELIPQDWKLHGTVGYDFLNALNGVFIKLESSKPLEAVYRKFTGRVLNFNQLLYSKKKIFALLHMASEINSLGHHLDLISERQRHYRDFTRNNLTLAIREVIACFPVYRTYISPRTETVSERDQKYIGIAVEKAKKKTPFLNPAVYDFLKKILLLQWEPWLSKEDEGLYRDFVLRFQQLAGPVMAKGMEDTAFYIYNRLLSLNEVGGDPTHFGFSPENFHRQNMERNKSWPYSFIASSTHDTKRSEDVRMRINVISEFVDEWALRIARWTKLNQKHKTLIQETHEPDRNTEYLIYQTLLGVWPSELTGEGMPAFSERMWNYFLKCCREAKMRTNWVSPDLEYEAALKKFLDGILSFEKGNLFLEDFLPFRKKIARFGLWNSLSALILKIGSPGVADIYQGCELWNYRVVDPDNRQPVNYEKRIRFLNELRAREAQGKPPRQTVLELASKEDDRLKLYVLWKGLNVRRERHSLFLAADYLPLKIEGPRKENVIAFARRHENQLAVVAAARFFTDFLADAGAQPVGPEIWRGTLILLPKELAKADTLKDIFTGEEIRPVPMEENTALRAEDVFRFLSAALLTN